MEKSISVVIGGSSGIGFEIACMLRDKGSQVIVTGRNNSKLKSCSERGLVTIQSDISDDRQRAELVKSLNSYGQIDHLILSAARYDFVHLVNEDDETVQDVFQTNVFGPVSLAKQCYPLLKKGRGKSVLFISSTLSLKPVPGTGTYSASKAALDSYVSSLALEWAEDGIRVNSILPGVVDTPIHDPRTKNEPTREEKMVQFAKMHPLGRVGETVDIAPVADLLLSPGSRWITGAKWSVDGGISLV
ncbi:MAG: hypothetical protein CR997_06460 [Acidobacteria bacterium]|nr:MAG: hypothetical protein CR997_06460 [Acidobacteriota bacterium]